MRLAIVLLLLAVSARGGAPEFLEPATLLSGPDPEFAAPTYLWPGDYDGDGLPDQATHAHGHLVTITWSDRGGASTEIVYPARWPKILGAGDLDGDGVTDLLVNHGPPEDRQVEAWYGRKGGRSFTRHRTALDPDDRAFVLADLNLDRTADIVSDHRGAVSVVLARRSRELDPPRIYFTGRDKVELAVDDIDGDGNADVAFRRPGSFGDVVQWLPGNGDGTFRSLPGVDLCAVVSCNAPYWPAQSITDVTGDGIPDYVIFTAEGVIVLPVEAGGGTRRPVETRLRYDPARFAATGLVAVGDIDRDGSGDAIVRLLTVVPGGLDVPGQWLFLRGRPDGHFEQVQVVEGIEGAPWPDPRDLDGDGFADFLSSDGEVVPGKGRGLFGTPYPLGGEDLLLTWTAAASKVRFADLDGNGFTDIVAFEEWEARQILLNSGGGKFRIGAPVGERNDDMVDFLLVDLTGDGIVDVVDLIPMYRLDAPCACSYVAGHRVVVHRGRGDATFDEPEVALSLTSDTVGFAAADHDGDGDLDLYAGARVYLGRGDGTFDGGPGIRGDLAAATGGHVFARRNHVYALLVEAPPRARLVPGLTVRPYRYWEAGLQATVTGAGAGLATGAVRVELGEEATVVVEVRNGVATLEDWPFRDGVTPIIATYSGDENFAPVEVAAEYHSPRRSAVVTVDTVTMGGRPVSEVGAGTPLRVVVSVSAYEGGAPHPAGGTLTIEIGGQIQTIEGTKADVPIDPALLVPGRSMAVRVWWSGSGPFNEAFGWTGVSVRKVEKRRSVR
ncbi:MAG TPA: VCBS repeat-containing protein [Thermoanaerobaculia bacterium]